MNVLIIGDDRAMLLMGLKLADKECDRLRTAQERLQVEDLNVRGLQALFGKIKVELKDAKRQDYDWDFTTRRAAGVALLYYRKKVTSQREGDEKVLISPKSAVQKLGEIVGLLEALSGQETLFTRSTAWASEKPKEKPMEGGANAAKLKAQQMEIPDGSTPDADPVQPKVKSRKRLQHRPAPGKKKP